MTDSYSNPGFDAETADKLKEENTQLLDSIQPDIQQEQQSTEQQAASDAKYQAEQDDPRNRDNWGLGGVVKELQSAFAGGIQDTASSIATLPERAIDLASGEMGEESKTEEGYKPEWDNWFKDDRDPIETKTWWGGLIRGATHFGTMAAAILPAAKVAGVAAAGTGLTAAIRTVPFGAKALSLGGKVLANQWGRGAAVGAASDLTSIYSQDANALQVLRDRYNFIDTPLTTNDEDHPAVKTFKNVVEGMGIGELANGLFRVMGKAKKIALPDGRVIDAAEDGAARGETRTASVEAQKADMAAREVADGPGYGPNKNRNLSEKSQAAYESTESVGDIDQALKRKRREWGAEEGSTGNATTPIQREVAARTAGTSEEVLDDLVGRIKNDPLYAEELANIQAGRTTMKATWEEAVEIFQRHAIGREAADIPASEWLAEFFTDLSGVHLDTPEEMLFWGTKYVKAGDLLTGHLVSSIRDTGIATREMFDHIDVNDIGGPAKQLKDKLVTILTETKRARIIQSDEFRNLGANIPEVAARKNAQKEFLNTKISDEVGKSIEALRVAFDLAGDSADDSLFRAIFETASMVDDLQKVKDFDAWVRKKLKGGELNGNVKTGVLIRELERVMIHSILSGPKTPVRAIMGTGSATFLRPISTAVGAGIAGDGVTLRASLASMNAIREAIPEAWTLFKTKLNAYWAGDIATVKSRFTEYSKSDEQWQVFGHWIENSGRATLGDKAAYYMANMARHLNDNKFLTYSTKIMAATDDTFGYLLARAKGKEKAMREALGEFNTGKITEITPEVMKSYENKFLNQILDADGNINIDSDLGKAVEYARREVTLTKDLTGFARGLNDVFDKTPWAKPFFLFARTGVNGLELTAKHTPVFNFLVEEFNQIARANPDDLRSVMKYGITTAEELTNAKALQNGRLAIGGSVITMAGMHFLGGGLTGNGPTDRQKRQVWKDAGWIPRSIKLGDVWVSYDAFEPFNQILATIADIGDHMELMGEEWATDEFQKLSLVVAQGVVSKSYLSGMQQFVDLFAGRPGQQNRIIAGLMNNVVPMSGFRNELGKLFTPHMKELNSGIGDSIRNRNLISEVIAADPLPAKYDLLTGDPIREYDFVNRMWNAVSPVHFNLDQSPGRKLLFDSGYDLRLSTYYAPDGTDLSNHPKIRSEFQRLIGAQNLELALNKLADDPLIQASMAQYLADVRAGRREFDPMKDYAHNKRIKALFTKARRKAWAQMAQNDEVKRLMLAERQAAIAGRKKLQSTSNIQSVLNLPVK